MLLTDRILRTGPALFEGKFAFTDFFRASPKQRSGGKWRACPPMPQPPTLRCHGFVRILCLGREFPSFVPRILRLGCKEIRKVREEGFSKEF